MRVSRNLPLVGLAGSLALAGVDRLRILLGAGLAGLLAWNASQRVTTTAALYVAELAAGSVRAESSSGAVKVNYR